MTDQDTLEIKTLKQSIVRLIAQRDELNAKIAEIEQWLAEQPKHYVLDAEPGNLNVVPT